MLCPHQARLQHRGDPTRCGACSRASPCRAVHSMRPDTPAYTRRYRRPQIGSRNWQTGSQFNCRQFLENDLARGVRALSSPPEHVRVEPSGLHHERYPTGTRSLQPLNRHRGTAVVSLLPRTELLSRGTTPEVSLWKIERGLVMARVNRWRPEIPRCRLSSVVGRSSPTSRTLGCACRDFQTSVPRH